MQAFNSPESLFLPAGGIKSFVFTESMQLRVLRGHVWLTIAGVQEDYWMTGGEQIALPANRQIVVEAHKTDSMFHLAALKENCTQHALTGKAICTES